MTRFVQITVEADQADNGVRLVLCPSKLIRFQESSDWQ